MNAWCGDMEGDKWQSLRSKNPSCFQLSGEITFSTISSQQRPPGLLEARFVLGFTSLSFLSRLMHSPRMPSPKTRTRKTTCRLTWKMRTSFHPACLAQAGRTPWGGTLTFALTGWVRAVAIRPALAPFRNRGQQHQGVSPF